MGLLGSGSIWSQLWLADKLLEWQQQSPHEWRPHIGELAKLDKPSVLPFVSSLGQACLFGIIEAVDPSLDAWAAAIAQGPYRESMKLVFEESSEATPVVGGLAGLLALPPILLGCDGRPSTISNLQDMLHA